MGRDEIKKIVYEDEGVTKVLKGLILEEDEFLLKVRASRDKEIITIGKRAIVKITNVSGGEKWQE